MPDTFGNLLMDMPLSVHGVAASALVAGLVIWAFGGRLVRPTVGLAGLVAGAALGLAAGSYLPPDLSIWWPVAAGAIAVGLVALAAYRFVMALMLALALGLAAPLAFFTFAELTGKYANEAGTPLTDEELVLPGLGNEANDKVNDWIGEGVARIDEEADRVLIPATTPAGEEMNAEDSSQWRRRLVEAREHALTTAAQNWKDAPKRQKWTTVLFALGGIGSGVIAGILLPTLGAAVVTALAGSLIVLVSGSWLAVWTGAPIDRLWPDTATAPLIAWMALAVIGLGLQFSLRRKKADKD